MLQFLQAFGLVYHHAAVSVDFLALGWRLPPDLSTLGSSFLSEFLSARLFGIHKNTVREWIKAGLPTCDQKRPALILGPELAAFLKARCTKNKRPCKPGEFYCVRCRAPKRPAGDMAEYQPITATLGNLCGICPDCEGMIYRRANMAKLATIQANLNVTFAEAERQVSKRECPSVNSDFSKGEQL